MTINDNYKYKLFKILEGGSARNKAREKMKISMVRQGEKDARIKGFSHYRGGRRYSYLYFEFEMREREHMNV